MTPSQSLVSFVVPCYRLGHLLSECVESILAQSHEHFEVLIMDDCSPDDTRAVAARFADPRVRYIRNETNLGNTRNYDRGIRLAQGEYVWLISADDKLREPYVTSRFVMALDARPEAAFTFCPSVRFRDGQDVDVYGSHGPVDRVFRRTELLDSLIFGNSVSAPAALGRREFYERMGGYPLDLPFSGDWYTWARFALEGEVIYHAEPMVGYRLHNLNITKSFTQFRIQELVRDEVEVAWRIRRDAERSRDLHVARLALAAIAGDYSRRVNRHATGASPFGLSVADVEASLEAHQPTAEERATVHARVYEAIGDVYWERGESTHARLSYMRSLRAQARAAVRAKYLCVRLGAPRRVIRRGVARTRWIPNFLHRALSESLPSLIP